MRVAFYTLGCKVNQYETEMLSDLFLSNGYDIVSSDDPADVYVINSCTVTSTGDSKSRKMLRHFRREYPDAVIALTGCFPQAYPDAAKELSEANVIAGASDRRKLVEYIHQAMETGKQIVQITPHTKGEGFEPMQIHRFAERTRAFVKIQDGCERYCAYCIIPKARGFIRSKALDKLQTELKELAENGYQEIVLVGINLSSYGKDLAVRLIDAIETACSVKGIERVRLGSLEPELLTDDDIRRMAALAKLCPQFHLSLQSGCDETLRRMRRQYDTAEYRRIVESLRTYFPDCAITTDIMVGFPSETEEEFQQSLAFVKSIGFARAHIFAYSPRAGTTAAALAEQIPKEEKQRRSKIMTTETQKSAQQFLQRQIGTTVPVLFETPENAQTQQGYTPNYSPVRVKHSEILTGQIHTVHIDHVESAWCTGSFIT